MQDIIIWGLHPVMEFIKVAPHAVHEVFILPSFGRKKSQARLLAAAEKKLSLTMP